MKVFTILALFLVFAGAQAGTKVELKTTHGTIQLELEDERAPQTVKNFLGYVKDKFYDGLIFHRVIDGFMIQGGGFDEKMAQKKTKAPIKNEASKELLNTVGTIAMARTNDPHSATAQFFINVGNNEFLNFKSATEEGHGYAVFGKVTGGMHVVERIAKVRTGNRAGHQNVPMDVVKIESAKILK